MHEKIWVEYKVVEKAIDVEDLVREVRLPFREQKHR